jgi:hypothetical protein
MLGLAAAVVISLALLPIAVFAPILLLHPILRAAFTVVVTFVVFGVVQSAAGMIGSPITAIAAFYSALAMLSNHVVWAFCGAPVGASGQIIVGSYWFTWDALGLLSLFVAIPLIFCTAICRDGVPGSDFFSYLCGLPRWGSQP